MAKQKEDRKTLELEGLKKPVGRPKGEKPPLTAAEKQRAYRARKAQERFKAFELSWDEQIMIYNALCCYGTGGHKEQETLKSQLLKRLEGK